MCCHTEIEVADKLATSPIDNVLILGKSVPALTLYHQSTGRVVTGVPSLKSQVGLSLKTPHWPRERKIPGSNPACAWIFSGSNHTSDFKLALQWLPCQTPGVIGSALGLVSPVSVYCDWVRWKV